MQSEFGKFGILVALDQANGMRIINEKEKVAVFGQGRPNGGTHNLTSLS